MSFVERVNQTESLANWLNWLTEPPAVCWSVIMGDLSASWKGVYWTLPKAFRTGPPSCAVHNMGIHSLMNVKEDQGFTRSEGYFVFHQSITSLILMMTSPCGKNFRVTGPLCRECTGDRWIPLTMASDSELWCFLWSALEHRLSKQSRRRWF